MRIISGSYRGKPLRPAKNSDARPTTDFAKESLFNIMQNHFDFEAVKVLDLFSGTGAISYEFASRGSSDVTAVELNFNNHSHIRKTAKELKFEQIKVIRGNAFAFLKACKIPFDIIFADPPYDLEGIEKIPDLVFTRNLLNKDGWLIIEHSKNINMTRHPNFFDHRNYGSVNFSFFKGLKD